MSVISPPTCHWPLPLKPKASPKRRTSGARNRSSPRSSRSMSRSRPRRNRRREWSPPCPSPWRAAGITGSMTCQPTRMIPALGRVLPSTVSACSWFKLSLVGAAANIIFVVTDVFVVTKVCLSQQTKITFVATKYFRRDETVCHDKSMLVTKLCLP